MRVAVVGCGYVGLITGVGLASVGHDVVGLEAEAGRREAIASGALPFHEPGLDGLLRTELASGRFRVSGDPSLIRDSEVILLAVQTPPDDGGSIDLRFLEAAVRQVSAELAESPARPQVVGVRSTVVPGTAERIVRPALEGRSWVASNPEFLREGSGLSDFLEPDRIVIGCDDGGGHELLSELYRPFGAPILLTSLATAELAKYASNALLATLISFSNEIARICEEVPGADVEEVLGILHRDRRLTPIVDGRAVSPGILAYLKAGCGFGGSCLPKDLSALLAERTAQGFYHPLLEGVLTVNETQADRVVDLLERRLGELEGRSVAVLGAAFKGGTDDVRASPGLRILDRLLERGVQATIFDPLVPGLVIKDYLARGVRLTDTLTEALGTTEACIVTTNAPEFSRLAENLSLSGPSYVVLDARRCLDPSSFGGAYAALGLGPSAQEHGVPSSANRGRTLESRAP
jgi:UDPglucose 6-dehydrogenase